MEMRLNNIATLRQSLTRLIIFFASPTHRFFALILLFFSLIFELSLEVIYLVLTLNYMNFVMFELFV